MGWFARLVSPPGQLDEVDEQVQHDALVHAREDRMTALPRDFEHQMNDNGTIASIW